jgi:dienelactone hydrolase
MKNLLRAFALLGVLSAFEVRADDECTALTTATTENCAGSCPEALVTSCPGTSTARVHSNFSYKRHLDVSACDNTFPKGCSEQRAVCECPGGAAHCPASHKRCDIDLRGSLWVPRPSRTGGYPVLIYSHGSVGCPDSNPNCSHAPNAPCSIVAYFVDHGYAVFTPIRRGYSPSTGTYGSDWADSQFAQCQQLPFGCLMTRQFFGAQELAGEAPDVLAAIDYLKAHHAALNVNPNRLALMGHSLGGIVTLFTNQTDDGQNVAVSISGDSESWCGGGIELRTALFSAVDDAKAPIYFFEEKNDPDVNPTVELSHHAGRLLERYQSAVFAPVRDASGVPLTCGKHAHVCFTADEGEVARWAPSVVEFLSRHGVK